MIGAKDDDKKSANKTRAKGQWLSQLGCKKAKEYLRHWQDSNLRGITPIDFQSIALTTRPQCRIVSFHNYVDSQVPYSTLPTHTINNTYSNLHPYIHTHTLIHPYDFQSFFLYSSLSLSCSLSCSFFLYMHCHNNTLSSSYICPYKYLASYSLHITSYISCLTPIISF